MKHLYAFLFPILLLQLNSICGGAKTDLDEGCSVKSKQVFNFQEDSSFNVSFFISSEDQITFHVYFVDQYEYLYNDFLILKPESGEIQHTRDGEASKDNVTLKKNIPLGWNNVTFTLQNNKLELGDFYSLDADGKNVKKLSFTSKYMTDCANKTPMWKIDKPIPIIIPLIGLSNFGIRLYSDQTFNPDLILNNLSIPLSYDEELVIRKTKEPLPQNDYMIEVKKVNNEVSLYTYTKPKNCCLLMKANTKEDIKNLIVSSSEGEFFLILDPFQRILCKEDYAIGKKSHEAQEDNKKSTKLELGTEATPVLDSDCKCNSSSSTVAWITASSAFTVIAILIFIINRDRRMKQKSKEDHLSFMVPSLEGGESEPLLNQDQIKSVIKNTYTETHGELNTLNNPHQKEICKIKLKYDKEYSNKKILDDLVPHKQTKVILVVGQTGSGKSSFINAMINYTYGVEYEENFRFKLVDDMDASYESGINNTNEITSYYIPYMHGIKHDCNLIFIDTPGFGDSRGIDEDKKWNDKFYNFIQKNSDIREVAGICFLIKVTDTRLTHAQKYIINGLFSMFGNDIKNNLYVVVSYSDGSETNVPKLLQESGLDYNLAINVNNDGLYNDQNILSESSEDVQKQLNKNWTMTMDNVKLFFKKLMGSTAVSLSLTNIVLEENKDIEILKDELLELITKEHDASNQEKKHIQSKIEENQKLLMVKLDEAQKLSGRLKNIAAKENPLTINEYIDILIQNEKDSNKISELENLKKRNTKFQELLKNKNSNNNKNSLLKYILGEKTEKTE